MTALDSPPLGVVMLLAMATGIGWYALRNRKERTVGAHALFAIVAVSAAVGLAGAHLSDLLGPAWIPAVAVTAALATAALQRVGRSLRQAQGLLNQTTADYTVPDPAPGSPLGGIAPISGAATAGPGVTSIEIVGPDTVF